MGYTGPSDKLTDALVREAKTNRQQAFIWDGEVKGFGLRVTAGGAKTFVLQYGIDGRKRRGRIGAYPDWSVEAARREAKELKKRVNRGQDPFGERIERRQAETVKDLCDRYEKEWLPKKGERSQVEDRRMIAQFIKPKIGDMKTRDVRYSDIDALHARLSESTPITANRVLALLSKMFALASGPWELREGNPCTGVRKNYEEPRNVFLKPAEIKAVLKILNAANKRDRQSAQAVKLLILTGARSGEVLGATWDQFDLDHGVWAKPSSHTKQKRIHRLPLNGAAVELLKDMKKNADPVYLFPGRTKTGPQDNLKKYWAKVRAAAGLPGVRPHDLRHTFASLLASQGESLPIIGALLGHTQAQTTARYAHLLDDPLRKASEAAFAGVGGDE